MEGAGEGDNDSDSSYSFSEGCLLFELNPRKGSLVLDADEDDINLKLNEAEKMKELYIKSQKEREIQLKSKMMGEEISETWDITNESTDHEELELE